MADGVKLLLGASVVVLAILLIGTASHIAVAARDEDALQRALGPALDRISAANATAYFRHCGYECPD